MSYIDRVGDILESGCCSIIAARLLVDLSIRGSIFGVLGVLGVLNEVFVLYVVSPLGAEGGTND